MTTRSKHHWAMTLLIGSAMSLVIFLFAAQYFLPFAVIGWSALFGASLLFSHDTDILEARGKEEKTHLSGVPKWPPVPTEEPDPAP